jgi:hypothetical protein
MSARMSATSAVAYPTPIGLWGYNIYSWCGESTYAKSGYKDRTEEFANYSVPVSNSSVRSLYPDFA